MEDVVDLEAEATPKKPVRRYSKTPPPTSSRRRSAWPVAAGVLLDHAEVDPPQVDGLAGGPVGAGVVEACVAAAVPALGRSPACQAARSSAKVLVVGDLEVALGAVSAS